MNNKIQIGIWVDNKNAIIVRLVDGKESIKTVNSNIESRTRIKGEDKQFSRMGKQFLTFEKSKEEKHKHQLKDYFGQIITKIKDADSIIILGPSKAKTELYKEISKSEQLFSKIKLVESADSMSDNQVVALIKSYFKN